MDALSRDRIIAAIPAEKIPDQITEHTALLSKVTDLISRIEAEQAPDLGTVTSSNVEKLHTQAVNFHRDHELRLRTAREIHKIATHRHDTAWESAVLTLIPHFKEATATAAANLTEQIAERGANAERLRHEALNPIGEPLRKALRDLATLSKIRDEYAIGSRPVILSIDLEQATRMLRFETLKDWYDFSHWRNRRGTEDYFFAAATTPGVTIAWQYGKDQVSDQERTIEKR